MGNLLSSTEPYYESSSDSASGSESSSSEEFDDSLYDQRRVDGIGIDPEENTTAVDAVSIMATQTNGKLTENTLREITQSLDIYEAVSLIYLLYEDPSEALLACQQVLINSNSKYLEEWAETQQTNSSPNWGGKILEALCTIQNFQILRKLGYEKNEVKAIFPRQSTCDLLNKLRKTLYNLCEQLNMGQTNCLIKKFQTSFIQNGWGFFPNFAPTNDVYLEIYLLYLETCEHTKNHVVEFICKMLKQSDLFEQCDDLKRLIKKPKPHESQTEMEIARAEKMREVLTKRKECIERFIDPKYTLSDLDDMEYPSVDNTIPKSTLPCGNLERKTPNDTDVYPVNPQKPGICLIINQNEFYLEKDEKYRHLVPPEVIENRLQSREGTEADRKKLENVFRKFNFRVLVEDNLTHSQLCEKIRDTAQTVDEESSLFICILSHGQEEVVYGVNSCIVEVSKIKEILADTSHRKLLGKPKFLIIQSCQGNQSQIVPEALDTIAHDGPKKHVFYKDFFTFNATVRGFNAYRDKRLGSFFIQSFCDKLEAFGNEMHFEDICTIVVKDVTNKKFKKNIQVPLKESTLDKQFYLPKIK